MMWDTKMIVLRVAYYAVFMQVWSGLRLGTSVSEALFRRGMIRVKVFLVKGYDVSPFFAGENGALGMPVANSMNRLTKKATVV